MFRDDSFPPQMVKEEDIIFIEVENNKNIGKILSIEGTDVKVKLLFSTDNIENETKTFCLDDSLTESKVYKLSKDLDSKWEFLILNESWKFISEEYKNIADIIKSFQIPGTCIFWSSRGFYSYLKILENNSVFLLDNYSNWNQDYEIVNFNVLEWIKNKNNSKFQIIDEKFILDNYKDHFPKWILSEFPGIEQKLSSLDSKKKAINKLAELKHKIVDNDHRIVYVTYKNNGNQILVFRSDTDLKNLSLDFQYFVDHFEDVENTYFYLDSSKDITNNLCYVEIEKNDENGNFLIEKHIVEINAPINKDNYLCTPIASNVSVPTHNRFRIYKDNIKFNFGDPAKVEFLTHDILRILFKKELNQTLVREYAFSFLNHKIIKTPESEKLIKNIKNSENPKFLFETMKKLYGFVPRSEKYKVYSSIEKDKFFVVYPTSEPGMSRADVLVDNAFQTSLLLENEFIGFSNLEEVNNKFVFSNSYLNYPQFYYEDEIKNMFPQKGEYWLFGDPKLDNHRFIVQISKNQKGNKILNLAIAGTDPHKPLYLRPAGSDPDYFQKKLDGISGVLECLQENIEIWKHVEFDFLFNTKEIYVKEKGTLVDVLKEKECDFSKNSEVKKLLEEKLDFQHKTILKDKIYTWKSKHEDIFYVGKIKNIYKNSKYFGVTVLASNSDLHGNSVTINQLLFGPELKTPGDIFEEIKNISDLKFLNLPELDNLGFGQVWDQTGKTKLFLNVSDMGIEITNDNLKENIKKHIESGITKKQIDSEIKKMESEISKIKPTKIVLEEPKLESEKPINERQPSIVVWENTDLNETDLAALREQVEKCLEDPDFSIIDNHNIVINGYEEGKQDLIDLENIPKLFAENPNQLYMDIKTNSVFKIIEVEDTIFTYSVVSEKNKDLSDSKIVHWKNFGQYTYKFSEQQKFDFGNHLLKHTIIKLSEKDFMKLVPDLKQHIFYAPSFESNALQKLNSYYGFEAAPAHELGKIYLCSIGKIYDSFIFCTEISEHSISGVVLYSDSKEPILNSILNSDSKIVTLAKGNVKQLPMDLDTVLLTCSNIFSAFKNEEFITNLELGLKSNKEKSQILSSKNYVEYLLYGAGALLLLGSNSPKLLNKTTKELKG